MEIKCTGNNGNRIGEKHITNEGYEVEIIEYFNSHNVTIRFNNDNLIFNRRYDHIKAGRIKNPFHTSAYNVGYLGVGRHAADNNGKATIVYKKWLSMLERGYCSKYKNKNPTYKEVTVCKEWHNFQVFAEWFENNYNSNYMQGWCLDKDILKKGNKVYSPETCCFVPVEINSLFTNNVINSSKDMKMRKDSGKYRIRININKKLISLKPFNTPEEAFQAYKVAKEKEIKRVADKWQPLIAPEVYDAMYAYQIEITD